ncbi:MAG TPA: imelysin family protein [Kofleriaceae bacterium]|jgi:iron uptake system component EfeO|nr:imelysin family protein [Kofleriaceae bacterium]
MDKTDADFRAEVTATMHTALTQNLADMVQGAQELQAAAPTHTWNAVTDAAAISRMRNAWKQVRVAWEQVEGAVAPMFAQLNTTMDARYEDFLLALGPTGDPYLFDDDGVIGMHAIERILFAPVIRSEVIAYERGLTGYRPAAYPGTDNEAVAFKTQLVQRLIDDATQLASSWQPQDVDIVAAYKGLVDLMGEQQQKVDMAAFGAEESRYSNITLFDLRNNLTGTTQAYELFREWIHSKASAASSDQMIQSRFSSLNSAYSSTPGDSLPAAPPDWSSSHPSADSDFGKLWTEVHDSVDPSSQGSVVFEMRRIAELLGFAAVTGITEPPELRDVRVR